MGVLVQLPTDSTYMYLMTPLLAHLQDACIVSNDSTQAFTLPLVLYLVQSHSGTQTVERCHVARTIAAGSPPEA